MSTTSAFPFTRLGSADLLDELFPGMVTAPDEGFDIAIEFDCENVAEPEEFLESISLLKRHVIGGPIRKALMTLLAGTSDSLQPCSVSYRKGEVMYVTPSDSKIFVAFLLDFGDSTDKAMARVFLQVKKILAERCFMENAAVVIILSIFSFQGICGSSAHRAFRSLNIIFA